MAQSLPSVSPQQHLSLTVSLTKSCLGQLSLPTNPPAHQPNPTGEHTSWYSSFLAHSPNFWLTQGLWWHSAEWKKNLCVVEDDENPLQCCFSPGSFLSSAWPVHCPSTLQDGPLAIPLLGQAHGAWCHRTGIQLDGNAAGTALESPFCHSCCHHMAATG